MEDGPLPDLRDIELKLGRKVPESLVRSLRGEEPVPRQRDRDPCGGSCGGGCSSSCSCCSFPPSLSSSSSSSPTSGSPRRSHSSTLERLETKLHLLRQEMVSVMLQPQRWGPRRKMGRSEEVGAGVRAARGRGAQCWVRGKRRVEERAGSARLEAAKARLVYHGLCSVVVCYDSPLGSTLGTF
jgi:hypothetical protein